MSMKCGTITDETLSDLIDNNLEIQNKLKELGITEDGSQLKIELKYSELLTEEEKKAFKKEYKKMYSKKSRKLFKKTNLVVKPGEDNLTFRFCFSDAVCDICYQNLQKRRKENSLT